MAKKCIICDGEAVLKIKDTADYYCRECAEENFADVSMLVPAEEEAPRLKEAPEELTPEELEKEE